MKHMRKYLTIVLAIGLLAGCGQNSIAEEASFPSEQSASVSSVPENSSIPSESSLSAEASAPQNAGVLGHIEDNGSLTAEPAADGDTILADVLYELPETLQVCIYNPIQQGYTIHAYDFSDTDTVGQLVKTVLQSLPLIPEDGIDVSSIRVEKSMAVVDLSLTEGSPAAWRLTDKTAVETMLHSIAATLNSNGFSDTGFLLNGGQFDVGGVTLEDDGYGYWLPVDLYNQPVSADKFAILRALLPYPGHDVLPQPMLASNGTVQAEHPDLYFLIYRAGDTSEYTSVAELDNEAKLTAAINTAPSTYECKFTPERYPLYPADDSFLEPLSVMVQDDTFTPQEWVESAVQALWGANTAVEHVSIGDEYVYHPEEGVYTPPHQGGGVIVEPYFHAIEQTGSGYVTEVSYLTFGMPGVRDDNDEWIDVFEDYEQDARVRELIGNKLTRYRITAVTGKDGNLYLQSSEQVK